MRLSTPLHKEMNTLDIMALAFSLTVLLSYQAFFVYQLKHQPSSTITGWSQDIRRKWVKNTALKQNGDILAVQSLRNWIISSTFLATVSMTISFGLLSFLSSADRITNQDSFLYALIMDPSISVKAIFILTCNFLSFFAFTQSIRYFNHVGFALGTSLLNESEVDNVARLLNTGAAFFTFGVRSFYCSFPFTFWLFGPIYFIVSTIFLVLLVRVGDTL